MSSAVVTGEKALNLLRSFAVTRDSVAVLRTKALTPVSLGDTCPNGWSTLEIRAR